MSTQPLRRFNFGFLLTLIAAAAIGCGDSGSGGSTTVTVTITAPGIVSPNAPSPIEDNPPTLTVNNATASDGSALTYASARSHFNLNLHLLRLEPGEDGLPRAVGEPIALTSGDGEWHVHNGGFTPDGLSVVYTRDTDTGNIYLVEGAFSGVDTVR